MISGRWGGGKAGNGVAADEAAGEEAAKEGRSVGDIDKWSR